MKKILFYCGFPPPIYLYKIAKSLKNNHQVILYTMAEKNQFNFNFYNEAFHKIYCSEFKFSKDFIKKKVLKNFHSLMLFIKNLKKEKPDIILGLSGNNWQLKLLHKFLLKDYPFVYFPYDILSFFFRSNEDARKNNVKVFELNSEKYCLEKLDGIIYKGDIKTLNLFNGKEFYNANVTSFRLSFPPYISKEFSVPINKNKLSKKDNEIHFVYPGFFLLNREENMQEISIILDSILNQKIHFHVYGLASHIENSDKYFKEMFKNFIKNKYFHLHPPLGPKEIVKEISKYDYGFYLSSSIDTPETKAHMGNKISTFLEAGLPIIYPEKCSYIDKIMKKYKIDISYNETSLKNIKKILQKIDYLKLILNLKKAREDFDMDKNIPRLEKFIEEVIKSKTT